MKKKLRLYFKFIISSMFIFSMMLPSFATLSSADGSAFVTKAEFDALAAEMNSRLSVFEAGINSKIDSQVTSYLDRNGIWSGKAITPSGSGALTLQNLADNWAAFVRQMYLGENATNRTMFVFDKMVIDKSNKSGLWGACVNTKNLVSVTGLWAFGGNEYGNKAISTSSQDQKMNAGDWFVQQTTLNTNLEIFEYNTVDEGNADIANNHSIANGTSLMGKAFGNTDIISAVNTNEYNYSAATKTKAARTDWYLDDELTVSGSRTDFDIYNYILNETVLGWNNVKDYSYLFVKKNCAYRLRYSATWVGRTMHAKVEEGYFISKPKVDWDAVSLNGNKTTTAQRSTDVQWEISGYIY